MNHETKEQGLKKRLLVCKAATISLAVISAILCALCYAFSFDGNLLYFDPSPLLIAFRAAIIASLVCSLLPFFILPKGIKDESFPGVSPLFPVAIAPAIAFLASAAFSVYCIVAIVADSSLLIGAIISTVCAAFYIAECFHTKISPSARAILGLSVIVWGVSIIATSYFDYSIAINSPIKTLLHFAVATVMIYSLCEMKLALEKNRSRFFITVSAVTLTICGACGLGSLSLLLTSERQFSLAFAIDHAIILTLFMYVLARLITFKPTLASDCIATKENEKAAEPEETLDASEETAVTDEASKAENESTEAEASDNASEQSADNE